MNDVTVDMGQTVSFEGRYWAVVHDGKGNVLRRTYPAKNTLTIAFFNRILVAHNANPGNSMTPVVGSGNSTPSESDTTLDSYLGKCNTVEVVSGSYSYDAVPDVDGNVYQKQTYVAHYLPGRLGSGSVNVAEAGMAADNISAVNGSTPLDSRGLLVDEFGAPTTISYDAANEYLDVYWEVTRWVKAEVSGSFNIDLFGVPTSHNYVVRPSNFAGISDNRTWTFPIADVNGIDITGFRLNVAGGNSYDQYQISTYACTGPLGPLTGFPTRTGGNFYSGGAAIQPLAVNKQRDFFLQFGPAQGNTPTGIAAIHIAAGQNVNRRLPTFQMSIDPPIAKDATRSFNIMLRCSAGNK